MSTTHDYVVVLLFLFFVHVSQYHFPLGLDFRLTQGKWNHSKGCQMKKKWRTRFDKFFSRVSVREWEKISERKKLDKTGNRNKNERHTYAVLLVASNHFAIWHLLACAVSRLVYGKKKEMNGVWKSKKIRSLFRLKTVTRGHCPPPKSPDILCPTRRLLLWGQLKELFSSSSSSLSDLEGTLPSASKCVVNTETN